MFKFSRVILAFAALSLAACGPKPSQEERVAARPNVKEITHIVCNQAGQVIFDEKATYFYVLNSGIQGNLADGSEFVVLGSACKWKAIPNVAKN